MATPPPNPLLPSFRPPSSHGSDIASTPHAHDTATLHDDDTDDSDLRGRLCGRLAGLFVTARDDKHVVALKLFLTRQALVVGFVTVFFIAMAYTRLTESMWNLVTLALSIIQFMFAVATLFTDNTTRALPAVLISFALMLFVSDMSAMVHSGYPRFVQAHTLLFALCTIHRASSRTRVSLYVLAGMHVAVMSVQEGLQLDGIDPLRPPDSIPYLCACEAPPCPKPPGNIVIDSFCNATGLFIMATVLHGFATRVDAKKRRLVAAIEVAEAVATNLSAFDLAATEQLLAGTTADAGHDLPPKLHAALTHILDNLKQYRPYLPDELFQRPSGDDMDGAVDAGDRDGVPGGSDGQAAVVFTDIRQSTTLWEHSGEIMRDVLAQHNNIIRTALAAWRGYEVKTIGDAFMIAFHTAEEAVGFGVEVQTAFAHAEWPAGLTRPNEDDGFGLLSVRIGVHWGGVNVERNTLTGRYDYFGPTVNAAARVEAHGIPGAVTVTPAVMEAGVGGEGLVAIPYAEARYGKGLGDALWLTALVGRGVPEAVVAHVRGLCEVDAAGQQGATRLRGTRMRLRGSLVVQHEELTRDESSMDSSSSQRSTPYQEQSSPSVPANLWTRHVRSAATVGVIKFAFGTDAKMSWAAVEDCIARRLQQLHVHLRATGGHVSTLLHNVALVSWGVYGRCPQYMNESVRCLLRLDEEYREGPRGVSGCGFHAGLATGAVSSGKVSASTSQTLLTMLGPCVDMALALCGGAAEVGTAALVASVADVDMDRYECSALLRSHLRAVDVWDMGAGRRGVAVYELRLGGLAVSTARRSSVGEEGGVPGDERAFAARGVAALEGLGAGGARHLPHALARGAIEETVEQPWSLDDVVEMMDSKSDTGGARPSP